MQGPLHARVHKGPCISDDKQNREGARQCGFEILLSTMKVRSTKSCVGLIHLWVAEAAPQEGQAYTLLWGIHPNICLELPERRTL